MIKAHKGLELKCCVCDKDITKYERDIVRNQNNYCGRDCYNNRRKENLKRLKRSTKYYDELLNNSVCACGVNEKYLLQIHHKDGNHNNNVPSNLEIVCANCHVRKHLKMNNKGELIYNAKFITANI